MHASRMIASRSRVKQAICQVFQYHAVECGHGNAASGANSLALLRGTGAGVVAIPTALAGAQGHAGTAGRAPGEARQQRRVAEDARRYPSGIARMKARLDCFEIVGRDDLRHRQGNPFPGFLATSGPRFATVEVMDPGVGGRCEYAMDARYVERLAPVLVAKGIHAIDDRLDPEWHG